MLISRSIKELKTTLFKMLKELEDVGKVKKMMYGWNGNIKKETENKKEQKRNSWAKNCDNQNEKFTKGIQNWF